MTDTQGTQVPEKLNGYNPDDPFLINVDDVEKAIPEGVYNLFIMEASGVTSSKKGTKGCELKMQVADGPYEGAYVTDTIWLSPGAMKRAVSSIQRILGHPIQGTFRLNPNDFPGLTCRGLIGHEENDGEIYARVKSYKPKDAPMDGGGGLEGGSAEQPSSGGFSL